MPRLPLTPIRLRFSSGMSWSWRRSTRACTAATPQVSQANTPVPGRFGCPLVALASRPWFFAPVNSEEQIGCSLLRPRRLPGPSPNLWWPDHCPSPGCGGADRLGQIGNRLAAVLGGHRSCFVRVADGVSPSYFLFAPDSDSTWPRSRFIRCTPTSSARATWACPSFVSPASGLPFRPATGPSRSHPRLLLPPSPQTRSRPSATAAPSAHAWSRPPRRAP